MTIIKKNFKRHKNRTKSIGFLLIVIILPLIFNTPLFMMFNHNNDKESSEKIPDAKNPIISSNHPNNANDYKFYKEITIDHTKVSGAVNLIDFPVLISIFDSDLHDNTQIDGDDVAFALDFEWLDYEIELYNQNYNSTHAQLVAWVQVPILSPSIDTVIRMYYGNPYIDSRENPTGVWDDNYLGVWHLSELSGNAKDSTSYGVDGIPSGGLSQGVSGKIGPSYLFSRDTVGTVNMGDPADGHLDFGEGDDFSISFWIDLDYFYYYSAFIVSKRAGGASSSQGYSIQMYDDNLGIPFYEISSNGPEYNVDGTNGCLDQGWKYVVVTWDEDNSAGCRVYLDGSDETSGRTGTIGDIDYISNNQNFRLNGRSSPTTSYTFDGKMDEVRISSVAKSADWIKTEYNNQLNPISFYNVGSEVKDFIPSINDFEYFKEITIDHTKVSGSNNLFNFPVLISIFDSDLHDYAQSDGDDIAFNNGTSWLFHEIEFFNQNYNSTHAHLLAWVSIPVLSHSKDTDIYMYYGNSTMENQENPSGVWDSNYKAVWHLSEDPTGTIYDSTSNNKDGTSSGSMTSDDQIVGRINGGIDFDGIDDTIGFGNWDDSIDFSTTEGSISVWILRKFGDIQTEHLTVKCFNLDSSNKIRFRYDNNYEWEYRHQGSSGTTTVARVPADIPQNEWIYVVMTWSVTNSIVKVYVNDSLVDSKTGAITPNSGLWTVHLASNGGDSDYYRGSIDETRISNVARSAEWIATEYNNQNDPSSFYSVGNGIKVDENAPLDASHFNHYKEITINSFLVYGSGYHSNFPLLISIYDQDLRVDVQADGDDIAFALGSSWLDHEIEVFNRNYNGTHAELVVWVRIPELSTALDTHIRMYYGNSTMSSRENPTGVWDGSYKGVWHLAEPSGFTLDSTSYSENGLVTGTVIRPSTGQISNAYNYGTDGTFNVGDPADEHLDVSTESFMVSMWINIDTSTGTWQIPLYKGASSTWDPGYCFATPTTGDSLRFHINDGISNSPSPSASIDFDSWTYIVGIVDRTNDLIRIYKDGYEVGSGVDISGILSLADTQNLDFQCAHPTYDFDGLLDEVRVLNLTRSNSWIKTEYYNQYDPNSFYSIGQEQGKPGIKYSNLQVNAIDLFGNPVPSTNISVYNQTILIGSNLTDSNGNTLFMNIIQGEYNFTASVTSDIGNHVEIVNSTTEAIVINQTLQTVKIICDISSNFFEVVDIDGIVVDSGWIVVGNSTHELQNCTIDGTGHARFWWVDTLPYQYNYTVYYMDTNYLPQIIPVASGDISAKNSTIQVKASLTTVDFTVLTLVSQQPVSGLKLLLASLNTGQSIVNLTSDNGGKATLRWTNSSGINGNYSLEIEFFGASRRFNMTSITQSLVTETNFTVSATQSYNIYIEISLENYETELISLNPNDYISVKYGSQLKLRMLFNVSKAVGAEHLLGPTYSDLMSYEIFKGAELIHSGKLGIEGDYIGTHYSLINTEHLESGITYLIFVSAQKSGYSIPQEMLLQLSVLENILILNQSQNDDSIQSVYWSESLDVSVKAYGEISESVTTEMSIFQSIDHSLRFYLPDINTNWNLTQITLNLYNISWNVNASDINLNILDPFGVNRVFNTSNHAGWDYNLGVWTGITINIDKGSPINDNIFDFYISGTFDNTIDAIVDASFIRNKISAQYRKYNVSNSILFLSESEGWAISNITFIIQNCYNTATWERVNLSTPTNLNISTAEGFKYSLNFGDENGNGVLGIDDRIIYPLDNQFLFSIESLPNTIFDVIIEVDYVQEFYQNQYLETLNISDIQNNIPNGGLYQLGLTDDNWDEKYAFLLINDINNQVQYFSPSEVAMNITIGGQTFSVSNTLPGQGIVSLTGLNKESVYSAVIETTQPVNFTLSYKISYLRKVTYETFGTVTYFIRESPDIFGIVNYYPSLGEYLQIIDTSLIDADYYTINLEMFKENYITASKDLDFNVMNRLTLINGDSTLYRKLEFIYVRDAFNFTFLYTDELTGSLITDLTTQYFMWEKYDIHGNVTDNGAGTLIQDYAGSLVLDFDSETKAVGDYLLIVNLEKENYEYKNAMILLTIQTRFLSYSLSNNFKDNQLSVLQGRDVVIQVNLTDPTQDGIPLLNATLTLTINSVTYNFTEQANGTYSINFRTYDVNTFFSSKTFTGTINITRDNYFSEQMFITIIVEMEEIFPGMPIFYFLIIIFAIIAVVGSLVGYRVIKQAKIPTFVKNVREIKKEIKKGNEISESLLYSPKEVLVGEIVGDKWSNIGLSIEDILGIEIKKSKKLLKTRYPESMKVHDQKPLGLILMKWDERIGVELLGNYPQDASVSEKTLMQIYGTHEYSAEKGLITLIRENLNVLSYYTGPDTGYYIVLILSTDDDPDVYEGAMANVAQLLLQNLEDDVYLEMIPSLFQRLSVFPSLSYEQNLIFCYQDSVKQMIINSLRDSGVITKSELMIWVKDRDLEGIIDLEAILAELVKYELIKVASVKGIPSELIFLTKDIFMLRVPPDNLFKDPVSYGLPTTLIKQYQDEVQKFFNSYYPTEEDTIKLLDNLTDPEVYETIRLLRTAIVTMKDFEKLKNKGVSDIYGVLRKLWDINMIKVFKDENGVEYYTLLTDFHVNLIFPKYLVNVIKVLNDQKSKSDKVLIQYLNILEETYYTLKSKED